MFERANFSKYFKVDTFKNFYHDLFFPKYVWGDRSQLERNADKFTTLPLSNTVGF